jgi:hypothetical protein
MAHRNWTGTSTTAIKRIICQWPIIVIYLVIEQHGATRQFHCVEIKQWYLEKGNANDIFETRNPNGSLHTKSSGNITQTTTAKHVNFTSRKLLVFEIFQNFTSMFQKVHKFYFINTFVCPEYSCVVSEKNVLYFELQEKSKFMVVYMDSFVISFFFFFL